MRILPIALLGVAVCSASCYQLEASAQVGYTQMQLNGDIGLSATGGGSVQSQDINDVFGVGDTTGSPYARGQVDFGAPVLTASAFMFSNSGAGTLTNSFGGIPAGTAVSSQLDFTNVKTSLAFDIPLGPIKLAPGVAIDLFDFDLNTSATSIAASEDVSVIAPVPMLFLRGEADLGLVGVTAEVGYLDTPRISDVKGTFWDAELLVEVRPISMLHLFAGYRFIHMNADGVIDKGTANEQDFLTDLDVSGWVIGGGIRF